MPSRKHWDHVYSMLEEAGLLEQWEGWLLEPRTAQDLVSQVNEGKIDEAVAYLDRAERLICVLREMDPSIDLSWDLDLLSAIRRAIAKTRIECSPKRPCSE